MSCDVYTLLSIILLLSNYILASHFNTIMNEANPQRHFVSRLAPPAQIIQRRNPVTCLIENKSPYCTQRSILPIVSRSLSKNDQDRLLRQLYQVGENYYRSGYHTASAVAFTGQPLRRKMDKILLQLPISRVSSQATRDINKLGIQNYKLFSNTPTPPNLNLTKMVDTKPLIGNFSEQATDSSLISGYLGLSSASNSSDSGLLFDMFRLTLEQFEHKFYESTFLKLISISPVERKENSISFVQSGLFLYVVLLAISMAVDSDTKEEIMESVGLHVPDAEKIYLLKNIVSSLPLSNNDVKFRWATRLVLPASMNVSEKFQSDVAPALQLKLERLNGTENSEELTKLLNKMVEKDSGGAMHNTFDEDELSEGVCGVLLTTLYMRARWRSAPTVLNGTRPFLDDPSGKPPQRHTRMIRINDIVRYSDLTDWDAEAIEISYATPGLALLILVPRRQSLRHLAMLMTSQRVEYVSQRMVTKRVAVTLPLYTLRMTLLLPGKLQTMAVSRLVGTDMNNSTVCRDASLRLSHGIQRLMFWSEAGRNAFKDDGLEWDAAPESELVVDRPYLFYVRWRNVTLMNGHFVL